MDFHENFTRDLLTRKNWVNFAIYPTLDQEDMESGKLQHCDSGDSTTRSPLTGNQPMWTIGKCIYTYIFTYLFCSKMTREIKTIYKQYGSRRTRLREHVLPPLKKEKHTNKSTNNKNSLRCKPQFILGGRMRSLTALAIRFVAFPFISTTGQKLSVCVSV